MSKDTVQADGQSLAEFSIIRLQEELAGSRRVQGDTLAKLDAAADTSARWKALARRYRAQLAAAQAEAAGLVTALETLRGGTTASLPVSLSSWVNGIASDALAALRKRGTP